MTLLELWMTLKILERIFCFNLQVKLLNFMIVLDIIYIMLFTPLSLVPSMGTSVLQMSQQNICGINEWPDKRMYVPTCM